MTAELAKRMLDACYLAKRARDMLPPLPNGVQSSYIQYLDVIQQAERAGRKAKISDISEALHLPRPGVTRTIKDMTAKGYLEKQLSDEDGRVTYVSATAAGRELSRKYDADYFRALVPYLDAIPENDAESAICTIQKFYDIMCERSTSLENGIL